MHDEAPARRAPLGHGLEVVEGENEDVITRPTDFYSVWRLLTPWLGYLLIGAAGVLGLFTASGQPHGDPYIAGMVTFGVAVVMIALRIRHQFAGRYDGLLLATSVNSGDALAFYIPIVGALGIGGLVLAAETDGIFHDAGFAFFGVCAVMIYVSVKRYFDDYERRRG